ncbi:MAG: DUF1444 family protein [Anaerolineales bacterium]|nr:DUF1444 family protein [Anaerolineales bacterium]
MNTLLTPEAFAQHVVKATRKAGYRVSSADELIVECAIGDESLRCNLETAYVHYQEAPEQLDQIVQTHLVVLRRVLTAQATSQPALNTDSLLPLLNRRERLPSLQIAGIKPALYQPYAAGLVITYVLDSPESMAYVNAHLLASIGASALTLEEVHTLAIAHLATRTKAQGIEEHGFGDCRFIAYAAGDGYAATRVLLPDLMASWAQRLAGRMLIGIPNRDFLIAFGDRDPRHAATMTCQVRRDAARLAHPLTGEVLVWEEGKVRAREARH